MPKPQHVITSIVGLAGAAVLIFFLFQGLKMDHTKIPSALLGKPAMPFQVAWIQGQEFLPSQSSENFKIEDIVGKPAVLNFWASWCVSCREEARDLERYWQTYAKANGILVVGIAIQDTQEAAKEFAKAFGKTYILGLDTDGKAAINYGVTGVPETFFIDAKGKIIHKEVGPVSTELLASLSQKLLSH
jgi:cytochrome c biogenesis protein CcmG, thiol:disulfide interchange protein DsbE